MTRAAKVTSPEQRAASDPESSVWVAANAGSGKTSVLTDRVLRLLLAGTLPSRILCITYTRAAAAEMQTRLFKRLAEWSVMGDADLRAALLDLIGGEPPAERMATARRLFTRMLEESPALRVQTIHSFCQSVLARFPLEAGIPPHFSVLDERSSEELLKEARLRLLSEGGGDDPAVADALAHFIEEMAEGRFNDLLKSLVVARRRFARMLEGTGGRSAALRAIRRAMGVGESLTLEALVARHFDHGGDEKAALTAAAQFLLATGKPNQQFIARAEAIAYYHRQDRLPDAWEDYVDAMTAKDGSCYKTASYFYPGDLPKKHPPMAAALERERSRIGDFVAERTALEAARHAEHLAVLADALFSLYEALKDRRGVLDYDDLILHARRLLCGEGMLPWVLYKLDGGLDHLLLDEAQDTAPEQWEITQALTQEFFAGKGATERPRTLFVVGDRKQSIYRFQGADPQQFVGRRPLIEAQAQAAGMAFREVELVTSFRSVETVLSAVDATFAGLDEGSGSGWSGAHVAHRGAQAGVVECWPLVPARRREARAAWAIPSVDDATGLPPERELALRIARTVRGWLDEARPLAATKKAIRPGDILILLRTRGRIGHAIGHALREHQVPVAGLDRVELTEDVAVGDLIALGDFVLLPEDDLNLAALLKSPLFDVDEAMLFDLCHGRDGASVWEVLRPYAGPHDALREAARMLSHWITLSQRRPSPFEFFSQILNAEDGMRRMTARLGEGARESVQSFLHQALVFERSHPPGLQGFLHWLVQGSSVVKRDMEQSGDAVRIMTVYGAKGLEAPIVFLPQMYPSRPGNAITFVDHAEGGRDLILKMPPAKSRPPLFVTLGERLESADRAEEMRLLYVAMTRAQDELYLCGIQKKEASAWYDAARRGIASLPDVEKIAEEHGTRLRVATAMHTDMTPAREAIAKAGATLPGFFSRPPPSEKARVQVFSPSRLADHLPAAAPPQMRGEGEKSTLPAHERGNLIHRLFEVLAGMPDALRVEAGEALLRADAVEATAGERAAMLAETLAILRHPDFAPVFAAGSLAEIGVAGTLEDGLPAMGRSGPLTLSGQIDRLVIGPETIWILDYKTGELPPEHEIPLAYRAQMEAYRALLTRIYPGRAIRCGLLYTAAPRLLDVPPIA